LGPFGDHASIIKDRTSCNGRTRIAEPTRNDTAAERTDEDRADVAGTARS
jgi:hypothetical protein